MVELGLGSWLRTNPECRTVGGFYQRERCISSAFEGDGDFCGLAGIIGGGRVEFGGEEEEEGGDGEGFHCRC